MNGAPPSPPSFGPVVDRDTPVRLAAQRLRNTLRLNTVTSGIGGLVAAVAPRSVDHWLDTGRPGWVRAVGCGLVAFAVLVLMTAGARVTRLMRWTQAIVAGDVAWVVASAATIAAGWYAAGGDVLVGAVAVMVAVFAVRQSSTLRKTRLHRSSSSPSSSPSSADEAPPVEVVHVERVVRASPTRAWEVITDHDLYGRLAPNLSRVHATTGNGPGLERSCSNRAGETWHETCTLWDDHHRYDVAVDTTHYPYPLEEMRGSWSVTALGADVDRCVVGTDFRYRPVPGVRGRLFAAAMQAAFPFVLRRILSGWQRHL